MSVVKRIGTRESIDFGKVQKRIQFMVNTPVPLPHINVVELSQRVIQGLHDDIHTSAIDQYSADLSASLAIIHTDYGMLAGRIAINNHHKNTLNSFRDKTDLLYLRKDTNGHVHPLITDAFYKFVKKHQFDIDKEIDYSRDYDLDYFGFKTLEKGYLMRVDDKVVERPQDLWMRVAIQLYINTDRDAASVLTSVFRTYHNLSRRYYTHATPTLFNSGTPSGNLSSCFLLGTHDSHEGILKTLHDATSISKWAGGIGIHVSSWRAAGSLIRGTNGESSGIVRFLRMYNEGARAFNQGGKRNGSFAIYLEPHHPDIMAFLELRRTSGDETMRCRDLFMAMWLSDLFMQRVERNETWSTFCPDICPNLNTTWGEEYEALYLDYEARGLATSTYPAVDIWRAIFESQKESGMPYLLYKDTCNRMSMQRNLGTISSSNLCVTGDTMILTDAGPRAIIDIVHQDVPVANVWNGVAYMPATFAQTGRMRPVLNITYVTALGDMRTLSCTPEHRFIVASGWRNLDEDVVTAADLRVGGYLIFVDEQAPHNTSEVRIMSIENSPILQDTYCFNEPTLHRGVFNGVLAMNCTEILLYSDANQYGTCNLASICLPQFVEDSHGLDDDPERVLNHDFPKHPVFNYHKLMEIVGDLVVNLNNVIDKNWYPVLESARSNFMHRPIGIGVQGLADVFMKFRIAFDSEPARALNRRIFETIYYAAVSKSTEMARAQYMQVRATLKEGKTYTHRIYPKEVRAQYPALKHDETNTSIAPHMHYIIEKDGTRKTVWKQNDDVPTTIGSYPSFLTGTGSPLATGQFHWELHGLSPDQLCGLYDWDTVRAHVQKFGMRNSLLVALMPTASTSQIMGSSSCFEPYVSNIYTRKTLAGEFIVINKYLIHDLQEAGLWSDQLMEYLKAANGSIQNIIGIPQAIKDLYKTVWEMSQRSILDMAADRQAFIDQSQSMNLYLEDFNLNKFTSMQFHAWRSKLKTGCYYMRTRPAAMAQKFTIDPTLAAASEWRLDSVPTTAAGLSYVEPEDFCLLCSS